MQSFCPGLYLISLLWQTNYSENSKIKQQEVRKIYSKIEVGNGQQGKIGSPLQRKLRRRTGYIESPDCSRTRIHDPAYSVPRSIEDSVDGVRITVPSGSRTSSRLVLCRVVSCRVASRRDAYLLPALNRAGASPRRVQERVCTRRVLRRRMLPALRAPGFAYIYMYERILPRRDELNANRHANHRARIRRQERKRGTESGVKAGGEQR